MKILTRYLLRAHVGPFLFAFLALTGVILINTLARRLADLAGKGLPAGVVLEFFVLSVPATVALTFPMAVLVAVLYTFSQLNAENEITALRATGVDLKRLLLPLLGVALAITVFMIWFNDRVLPEANHRWSRLWADIARATPTMVLEEQTLKRIQPRSTGDTYYLRAARVDPATNRMWDVALFDVSDPGRARTIYADSGVAVFNESRTDLILRLFDGHIREVDAGRPEVFQHVAFREQVFGVPGIGEELNLSEEGFQQRGDREMTVGMMRARIDTIAAERRRTLGELRASLREDLALALGRAVEEEPEDGAAEDSTADSTVTAAAPVDGGPRPEPGATEIPLGEVASAAPGAGEIAAAGAAARFADTERTDALERTRRLADRLGAQARRVTDLDRQIRELQVEIHKKFSIAVATLVFVILGAPLALRFPAGGIGMVIASSLVIFALYYVGLIGGEALADAGWLTPAVTMWSVNAAMTVLGLYGLARMGRETATARSGLGEQVAGWLRRFGARRRRAA